MIDEGRTVEEGLLHCKALTQASRDTASCTAGILQILRAFGRGFLGNEALAVNLDSVSLTSGCVVIS